MTALLEIENLEKMIGNLHLGKISLDIQPGYIVGLIGINGSGKKWIDSKNCKSEPNLFK